MGRTKVALASLVEAERSCSKAELFASYFYALFVLLRSTVGLSLFTPLPHHTVSMVGLALWVTTLSPSFV